MVINKKELVTLLINLICVKMLFTYPRYLTIICGNSAWINCIYVSLLSFLLFLATFKLYEKTGKKGILELAYEIGKRPFQIIVGLIIICSFILNTAMNTRIYPESVKNVLLTLTPMSLIVFMLAIAVAICTFCGFQALMRTHAICVPIVIIIFSFLSVLLLPYININNIFPIMGTGVKAIFAEGLFSLSIFSDMFMIYLLLPFCENYRDCKKGGIIAIISASAISITITLLYNLVYPAPASADFIFPIYQITRLIKIGDFFARLDAFFEFFWSFIMMIYYAFYLFMISFVFSKITDIKNIKPVIIPMLIIILSISYLPQSSVTLLDYSKKIYTVTTPILIILPILIPIIYKIKFRK